jgi:EmrB/QacA subfamily drug resistance transporter
MVNNLVSTQNGVSSFTVAQKKIALIVVSVAFVMDLLDSTIVNIAIPSIQTNLGASFASIQWLVAGYLLAFATLLVTGGRMGDVFGYKKIFMIGVAGFTVASLLSGLAWSPEILIATRVLQGAMAALMVPQVISTMQIMYKPSERGVINGLFGTLGGLAATLGPVVGGLLIQVNIAGLDWRPIFLINVPIGIAALILAAKYLPSGKSPHPLKLDIRGTFILVIALTLLIFPLIQGRELDWPIWTIIMACSSIPVFALFVWSQLKRDKKDGSALVEPSLFKNRSFGTGLLVNLTFEAGLLGYFLTFGLFLQIGLGYSAIHAALSGLPLAVGITATMVGFGSKIALLGRRALILGALIIAIGLSITTLVIFAFSTDLNSFELIPGLIITGVGMGLVFGSLYAAVLNGVDAQHAGSASGTLNAVQQIGGAIGVAIIGVVFFGHLTTGAAGSFASVEPQIRRELSALNIPIAAQDTIIGESKNCFVDRAHEKDATVVPPSCKALVVSPSDSIQKTIGDSVTKSAKTANTVNFQHAFRWAVVYEVALIALTFGISFLLPKKFELDAHGL